MKGIDVSSWQGDIHPENLGIDFCIAKATEGTNYVNPYCDPVIQRCINAGMPWGFYHFASGLNARNEAEYFIDTCENYFGHGIPVLDYEIFIDDNVGWCETFMQHVHELSSIWPMLYISASRCIEFAGSWIPSRCGLWVAGYPYAYSSWTNDPMPYDVSPWPFAAIWQFTSSLQLPGFAGNFLDGNIAYMDASGWAKYANSTKEKHDEPYVPHEKNLHELAREIVLGEWGTGADRKRMIAQAGYDYSEAQAMVNKYYELAHECIHGIWGNGWNRQNALTSMGYDYDTVQMIVNALMKG